MGIINRLWAILAALLAVVLGVIGIHASAKKQGAAQARQEDAKAVQEQAAEARAVVKEVKQKTETKSDAEIKQVAKSKYVRGANNEK